MSRDEHKRVVYWVRALQEASSTERPEILEQMEAENPRLRSVVEAAVAREAEVATVQPHSISVDLGPVAFEDFVRQEELPTAGGMGEVYRVRRSEDPDGQDYALKVIRSLDARHIERFESEKLILSKLRHPQISRYYQEGETPEGRPYFVMEYVHGVRIDESAGSLDVAETVRLVAALAAPLTEAHTKGIFHRDITPANVLVRGNGLPVLIDFGIAKSDSLHYTEMADRPMTRRFGAPEQVFGWDSTAMTDVHGMGMLLYFLLSGRGAYGGDNLGEWWTSVQNNEPLSIRAALAENGKPPLPSDLALVIDKAIRKEPGQRYLSCKEFAEDLENALTNKPVKARPLSLQYTTKKFVRRNWIALGTATAVLLLAILGVVVYTQRIAAERDRVIEAQRNTEIALDAVTGALHLSEKAPGYLGEVPVGQVVATLDRIREDLRGADEAKARILLTTAIVQRDLAEYEDAEWRFQEAMTDLPSDLQIDAKIEWGGLLHRREDYAASLAVAEEALPECLALRSDCGTAKNEYALALFDSSNAQKAARVLEENVRELEVLGDRFELSEAYANLAVALLATSGSFDRGIEISRKSLALREELLGPDHILVGESHNNIAMALGMSGQLEEAERHSRRSLAVREAKLGPLHPYTLQSVNSVAQCLRRMPGRQKESMELFQRAIAGYRQEMGPGSERAVSTTRSYALLRIEMGALEDAEKLLADVLQTSSAGMAKDDLGKTYRALGQLHLQPERLRPTAAVEELGRAEELLLEALGDDSQYVADTSALLGLARELSGEVGAACDGLRTLVEIAGSDSRRARKHQDLLSQYSVDCS